MSNEDSITFLKRFISSELYGSDYVEIEHLPVLCEFLDIDIYIISENLITSVETSSFPLAGGTQIHRYVRGPKFLRNRNDIFYNERDRPSVVINFVNNLHYELIGKQLIIYDKNSQIPIGSKIITLFDSSNHSSYICIQNYKKKDNV